MNQSFFSFCFLIILNFVYGQQHFVYDHFSNKPISFELIRQSDTVYYTQKDGSFIAIPKKGDSISIDVNGYQPYANTIHKLNDTVFLYTNVSTKLKEVIVSAKKRTSFIGYKRDNRNFNALLIPKVEFISLFLPQSGYKNKIVQEIQIHFDKPLHPIWGRSSSLEEGEKAVLRLHIYSTKNGELPIAKVYSSTPIILNLYKQNKLVLDLSNADIQLEENGFGIGVEFIGYLDKQNKLKKEDSHISLRLTSEKTKEFVSTKNYHHSISHQKMIDSDSLMLSIPENSEVMDEKYCITLGMIILDF